MRNLSYVVAVLAFVLFLVFPRSAELSAYVESNETTVVHYHVDSSNMYVLWFDQLIAETADVDTALFVCESMDGLYDSNLDECTVDALPLYVETVGANLGYFFHEL